MAIIRDLTGTLSSWHTLLRQGGILLWAIFICAVMGPYWLGFDFHALKAGQVTHRMYHQLVGELSSMNFTRRDPIFVSNVPYQENRYQLHLSIEKNARIFEIATFLGHLDCLMRPNRPLYGLAAVPFEQSKRFAAIETAACWWDQLAVKRYLQIFGWGISSIREAEFRVNHFAKISWNIPQRDAALALDMGFPIISNGFFNAFEVNESALTDQNSFIKREIGDDQNDNRSYGAEDETGSPKNEPASQPNNRVLTYVAAALLFGSGWLLMWGGGVCFVYWNNRRGYLVLTFILFLAAVVAAYQSISLLTSAIGNSSSENVVVKAVIEAELKLSDIERHVDG